MEEECLSFDMAPLPPIPIPSKPNSTTLSVTRECGRCFLVPASPQDNHSIFADGRIVCVACFDEVNQKRELERKQLRSQQRQKSQQLAYQAKCPNYDAGCRVKLTSTEIKEDHLPKCYYRDVLCNEGSGVEVCNDVSIPFKDFRAHLKQMHQCDQFQKLEEDPNNTATVSRPFRTVNNKLQERGYTWPLEITLQNLGKTFLLHNYILEDVLYFWVTVLADKQEADKHQCKLTLHKATLEDEESNVDEDECNLEEDESDFEEEELNFVKENLNLEEEACTLEEEEESVQDEANIFEEDESNFEEDQCNFDYFEEEECNLEGEACPMEEEEFTEKNVKCWTLPVLPYHDYSKFKDEFKYGSPLVATIPAPVLYEYSEKVGTDFSDNEEFSDKEDGFFENEEEQNNFKCRQYIFKMSRCITES